MKTKISIIILFFYSQLSIVSGQNIVTGKVVDAANNEPMALVNVVVEALKTGTSTDFEGVFHLKLPDGKHKIEFKNLGYKTEEKIVELKGGKSLYIVVEMHEANQALDEVIIEVVKRKNTERSVLALQKKSLSIVDGLSAQTFRVSGISNLASAIKKIVGVHVQDGKYVYVRGLGDRYTKTILNKIDIPGLDPDRNTIQMDLFPTSILQNVLVYKTFTADLPADFTGGVVNMTTKDFPGTQQTSFSIGIGYNPYMNFKSHFLTFKGGKWDFLAIDDGTYEIPISLNEQIPYTFDNDPKLTAITKKFNPQLAPLQKPSLPNYNFSFYTGNRFDVGSKGNSIGYITSFSYKTTYKFYENLINNTYEKYPDRDIYELESTMNQTGSLGTTNVILSALGSVTYKTQKNKYKFNVLHIRNGEKNAGMFWQDVHGSDFVVFKKSYLAYTQRNITNLLLNIIHSQPEKKYKIDWKLAYTRSGIYDKDVRSTSYKFDNNQYTILQNNQPRRIWRNLSEDNYVAKMDFKKNLKNKNKLLAGLSGTYKVRDYGIYQYQLGIKGNINLTGNANELLDENNIWTPDTNVGTYILNQSVYNKSNLFNAKQINLGGYVSGVYNFNSKFKAVLGVRLEKYILLYTGENIMGTLKFDNDQVLNTLDIFPTVNLTYKLSNETNIKFSYAKTTARPSFKEASIAEIYDPLSNTTFIGNIFLKPSYIQNLDLRYEHYGENTDMFAINPFYKHFKDPIEMAIYASAPNNYTPRNLGNANVYGLELEVRKQLDFINPQLRNFKINLNASYIKSEMQIYDEEYQLRLNTARTGENVSKTRPLQGQAPYIINAGLVYDNKKIGLTGTLSYNTQGETLERVGGGAPDIYSKPFNSLNLHLIKKVGEKSNISFGIKNILNDKKELFYKNYKACPKIFSLKKNGITFNLKYTVRF